MDEEEQDSQPNPSAGGPEVTVPERSGNTIKRFLIVASFVLLFTFLFSAMAAAVGLAARGLNTSREPSPLISPLNVSCPTWAGAHPGYQDLINAAASKDPVQIQPALVAAMHLAEQGNGTSWPTPPLDGTSWPKSGVGAEGPFQFMPGTWRTYGINRLGYTEADVNNFGKAANASALYMFEILKMFTTNTMTTDEKDIRIVAGAYNWGEGHLDTLKKSVNGESVTVPPETIGHMNKVWNAFYSLNVGCVSLTNLSTSGGSGLGNKVIYLASTVELPMKDFNSQGKDNNKYTQAANMVGQPWCAMFIAWVYKEAGYTDFWDKKLFGAGEMAKYVKENGTWVGTIPKRYESAEKPKISDFQPGDVLLKYGSADGLHVAIVEKVNSDGTIDYINGNTPSDLVARSSHVDINKILGVGRPNRK